jgi:hypothetical protein
MAFQCAGKYPLSKTALNSCVKYCIPIVGCSLDFAGDEVVSWCFFLGGGGDLGCL